MRKSVRDYIVFYPFDLSKCEVRAVYTDGSTRTWVNGDTGFKAARAKAMRPRR